MQSCTRLLILFLFFLGGSTSVLLSQEEDLALDILLQEENYEGVILIYDYKNDKLFTSDSNKTDERVLPASTFKILNTLLFLELDIVKDTSYTLPWNGHEYKHKGRKIAAWNKDTNLAGAFRNSTVWYYKALSQHIDLKTYQEFMNKLNYGKVYGRYKEELDFWNYGRKIGVSARDQISFLIRLYDNKINFKQTHIDIVKDLMIEKQIKKYILRSKTGWTTTAYKRITEGKDLGWYIGYVEFDDNVYFFVVRLEKPMEQTDAGFSKDRKKIARKALLHRFGIGIR